MYNIYILYFEIINVRFEFILNKKWLFLVVVFLLSSIFGVFELKQGINFFLLTKKYQW